LSKSGADVVGFAIFDGVTISGIAASAPAQVIDNLGPLEAFTVDEAAAVVAKTGIRYRRAAPPGMCASDLCFAAGDHLLRALDTDRNSIDALIFVSQTPDYRMPATALLLQHRLGLKNATSAFDVNLGCSGYIQGLMLAYSLASNHGMKRVLLLNGETRTKAYSSRDKATAFLFGDAGAATLVERRAKAGGSFFSMNSDGGRANMIMIKSGGYRNPSTVDSLTEKQQPDGGWRSDEHGYMNGAGVFEFLMTEVPQDIQRLLDHAQQSISDIDHFIFHQANRFMNEHLRRKLKIPVEKMPYSLDSFGNTSGVSIPLTMVTRNAETLRNSNRRFMLAGFGVGLSWGSAILEAGPMCVPDLIVCQA
jgi:3-oxoacyl-[acyl-carrier-protein] synthase-3